MRGNEDLDENFIKYRDVWDRLVQGERLRRVTSLFSFVLLLSGLPSLALGKVE